MRTTIFFLTLVCVGCSSSYYYEAFSESVPWDQIETGRPFMGQDGNVYILALGLGNTWVEAVKNAEKVAGETSRMWECDSPSFTMVEYSAVDVALHVHGKALFRVEHPDLCRKLNLTNLKP